MGLLQVAGTKVKPIEYNDFVIEGDEAGFCMRVIRRRGKGALPKELQGLWSTTVNAKQAIDNYVKLKEVDNGKAATAS